MDASLQDLWSTFDEETERLHDALDLLYAMCEAARSDELDHKRYSNAFYIAWEQLHGIERRFSQLNEAFGAFLSNASNSADLPQSATS